MFLPADISIFLKDPSCLMGHRHFSGLYLSSSKRKLFNQTDEMCRVLFTAGVMFFQLQSPEESAVPGSRGEQPHHDPRGDRWVIDECVCVSAVLLEM